MKTRVIRVNEETYDSLLNQGTMRDTFDTVVQRLIQDSQKWYTIKEKLIKDVLTHAQHQPEKEVGTFKELAEILRNMNLIDGDLMNDKKEKRASKQG